MRVSAGIMALLAVSSASRAADDRKLPYWASISAGLARMRTGPDKRYPAVWLYRRAGLPVKVVETYPSWRKVEDPGGERGWMQVNLLSSERTAMVMGETRALRENPSADAKILWRAEPGVIGRISHCADGWCEFDVHGQTGYVQAEYLWGVDSVDGTG